jgi:hypothetical protein
MIGRIWRRLGRVLAGMGVLVVLLAGVGAAYQAIATRRDLAAVPPPGRLVDIGAFRLHIWCTGSGSPTVILESGLGGGAFTWPQVQPEVAEFTQVCAYDRAGLGYSDPSPSPRTSGQIAKELALLIEHSDIRGPVNRCPGFGTSLPASSKSIATIPPHHRTASAVARSSSSDVTTADGTC